MKAFLLAVSLLVLGVGSLAAQDVPDSLSVFQRMKALEERQATIKKVEKQPEFPGGMAALMNFLATEVKYPKSAIKNNIQGKVVVTFVVEKDGSLSEATVVQSVSEELDQEALRVVSAMPAWQPGTIDGEPIRARFTLPISFRFSSSTSEPQKQEGQPEEGKKKKKRNK